MLASTASFRTSASHASAYAIFRLGSATKPWFIHAESILALIQSRSFTLIVS